MHPSAFPVVQDDLEGEGEDGNDEDAKDLEGDGDDGEDEEGKEKEGFETLAPEEEGEEQGEDLKEDEQQPQVRHRL